MRNQEIASWDIDYKYLALSMKQKANEIGIHFPEWMKKLPDDFAGRK